MKKISLFLAMCITTMLSANAQTSVWDGSHSTWTKGDGTQANPYLIENAAQLAHLAYIVNNGIGGSGWVVGTDTYWKLMTDVDLNGSESFQWTPIGGDGYLFVGHFDGNNHTIANLYINSAIFQKVGLFGSVYNGSIKNVGIISGNITVNSDYAGGVVGYTLNTTINNCYNAGNISSSSSSSFSSYSSYSYSGGIAGYSTSTINNCYNTGSISSSSYAGGIAGYNTSTINNCYNTGSINSSSYASGIAGLSNNATINNCYNTGSISGNYKSGISFTGDYRYNAIVTNSYYLVTCGAAGQGQSKTAEFMKTVEFVTLLNNGIDAYLAFAKDIAPFVNNGFPILVNSAFEIKTFAAKIITRNSVNLNGYIHTGTLTIPTKGFQYKTSSETTYTSVSVSSTTDTLSCNLTGLQPNTTYQYRTFATDASGSSAFGDELSFTTPHLTIDNNGNYLIENKEDLILLANLVNDGNSFTGSTFILANHIVLPENTPNNILSIGNYSNNKPFSGTFNGNDKRIYNVFIDQPNNPYQGFFGYTKNAYITNLGLVNTTASGRNYTGGMVAYAENTDIRNSYVSGGTLFALSYCGGLVGYQTPGSNSVITACYNTELTVTGNNYVGGLLGYSNQGTVRSSYVAAMVVGEGTAVGAIIGGAQDVLYYNCNASDAILTERVIDGIGENKRSNAPSKAPSNDQFSSQANDNLFMSSAQMRSQNFVNTLNSGLTTSLWKMDYNPPINNGFPILIWQTNQIDNAVVETWHAASLRVAGYYNILGQKLPKEPESGIYIIMYDNGNSEKAIK